MKKAVKIGIATSMFAMVVAVLFVFIIFRHYGNDLPDYEQLKDYTPMTTTRIYAADGSLVSEFSKEKRIFVPIEDIPQNLINAFLAAEDANFYKHSGVDPFAIFRTSVNNMVAVFKGDSGIGGASTITQQVVKNFLLTKERTFQRKIKEAILAFRISQTFSKEHILEMYLNQIYLGSGSYGVAAAAQVYFDKPINELTLEECALLATLPKAPSKLDPRKNIVKAKERRDWVIKRMFEEEFITEEEVQIACEKPITLKEKKDDSDVIQAHFFSDSVKKELTELYGSDNVFEDGIVVATTLKPDLQKIANKAFEAGIEDYDIKHGYRGPLGRIEASGNWQDELRKFDTKKLYKDSWYKAVILSITKDVATIGLETGEIGMIEMNSVKWARKYVTVNSRGSAPKKISDVFSVGEVILAERIKDKESFLLRQVPEANGGFVVMDPHNGRVLAMSGGYVDAPNQFNRATQAMRQPGSTMKTFGYIAALENGMTPASIIMDEPISINQGPGLPPYRPSNYSNQYYGPTTLRRGLENSINVTTVRMAEQIGLDKVVDVVKRFGVNDSPQKIYSLILGSTETTVLRMATAYSMMVNGGKKITPALIEKIQDRDGKTIYRRDKRECAGCFIANITSLGNKTIEQLPMPSVQQGGEMVTDSATAYQITSMLQGVVERGTAARAKAIGKIVAGKTGTTNNSYDSWFVGFSPDLVVAVYVGFDSPKSLGSEETGASVALPVFINFMKDALKDKYSTPFRVPDSVQFVKIDRQTGKFPTPETPSDRMFSEAFKITDEIEESDEFDENKEVNSINDLIELNGVDSKSDSGVKILDDESPTGIY